MKKFDFDNIDVLEKIGGGILGVVAIGAAIAELVLGGVDAASIAGTIKDVSGTAIVVVLLGAFLRSIPTKPKNIIEILEKSVEDWGNDNVPLIFKTEGYVSAQNSEYTQGFVLLQNPRNYVSLANSKMDSNNPEWKKYAQYGSGKLTGKFLDMPSYATMTQKDFDVLFVMEQSHFKNMPEINSIVKDVVSAVNAHCEGSATATRVGESNKFRLSCKRIEALEDVNKFIDTLDFVLSLIKVIA